MAQHKNLSHLKKLNLPETEWKKFHIINPSIFTVKPFIKIFYPWKKVWLHCFIIQVVTDVLRAKGIFNLTASEVFPCEYRIGRSGYEFQLKLLYVPNVEMKLKKLDFELTNAIGLELVRKENHLPDGILYVFEIKPLTF